MNDPVCMLADWLKSYQQKSSSNTNKKLDVHSISKIATLISDVKKAKVAELQAYTELFRAFSNSLDDYEALTLISSIVKLEKENILNLDSISDLLTELL